jgi:hypothetical protein
VKLNKRSFSLYTSSFSTHTHTLSLLALYSLVLLISISINPSLRSLPFSSTQSFENSLFIAFFHKTTLNATPNTIFNTYTTFRDINKLIMNYLVIEGYKDAAENFSLETGLKPSVDLSSIQDRMNIRNDIQQGNVESAIQRVNDLDPEVILPLYFF